MALDKVPVQMMTPMDSASETAPSNPNVGQRWFRLSTGVTYQYTNDGTSSFWLDVTSGGIGTSNYRAVNFVGDTDPHPRSNIAGAVVGAVYYNREGNRYFELIDATNNANVWRGSYSVVGGEVTTYIASDVTYRIHVFWGDTAVHGTDSRTAWPTQTDYMLYLDKSVSADVLMVAGGGGGGGEFGGGGAGGGVLYAAGRTIPAGSYPIKVGVGGRNGLQSSQSNYQAEMGGSTTAFGATIYGGGPGMSRSTAWAAYTRTNMANGGGAGEGTIAGEAGTATSSSGFVGSGGSFTTSGGYTGGGAKVSAENFPAGGGAGAGANGVTPGNTSAIGGNGGDGIQVGAGIYNNVDNFYWAGGGGGGCYNTSDGGGAGGAGGGGGGASYANGAGGVGNGTGITPGQGSGIGNAYPGGNGGRGTGGGGGGSTHQYGVGGVGGSGIVIVKYAIN